MKLLLIPGSISERSMNKRVAKYFENTFGSEHDISQFDLKSLPMYNQDIEGNPPQEVLAMREQFAAADAIIIITPEYNYSMPGVLKNMLDWASRGVRAMKDKPVLVAGASQGKFATVRAQLHLVEVLASPGVEARRYPPQILIGEVQNLFDADGNLSDADTDKFIKDTVAGFVDFASKH